MAYDGYGIPQLNFAPLAQIPQDRRQAQAFADQQRLQRNREMTLADLAQGPPIADVSRKLFAAGDVEGGLSLARLAEAQSQNAFQRNIAERNLRLHEQAADKPQVAWKDDGSGNPVPYLVSPGGQIKRAQVEGETATGPANPFSTGGKMTEAQSKDALYAGRMLASEKVLRDVESVGTSTVERGKGYLSDKLGYNLRGDQYQKFDQAQRDFINATLRRESGAVISPSEFDNANKQYFPMPGDTKEVIEQKRANRREAIRGIGAGAGQSWRPDYTFDQQGNIVPNQPKAKTATAATPSAARTGGPARPASKAEYDALPSGTPYVAPDGSVRTKK